ncbi:hypothetical protein NDU88_009275 [Pleurodeles waltl]|uniref:Uncharacterized protein n=1 Tax=Pleurodeles waltl TaxID=8319 RepID=A0AAV7QX37_PLEWA|nr:hypothetical protein NDU88_009275 [Pleurodeles waltl]
MSDNLLLKKRNGRYVVNENVTLIYAEIHDGDVKLSKSVLVFDNENGGGTVSALRFLGADILWGSGVGSKVGGATGGGSTGGCSGGDEAGRGVDKMVV